MTMRDPFGGGMRDDIKHFFGPPGVVGQRNRERRVERSDDSDDPERERHYTKRRGTLRDWPVRIGDPPLFETIVVARDPEEALQKASVAVEWRRVGSIDPNDLDLG